MKFQLASFILLGLQAAAALATRPAWAQASNSVQLSSTFTLSSRTAIPNKVLKPGAYTIQILDHLSDRAVLRIQDGTGHIESIFLGVQSAALRNGLQGPVAWEKGDHHQPALRGFAFPGGGAIEFVYPKEQAVAIAKENSSSVEAIDPGSDDARLANKKNLAPDDLQMLTLWVLTPTRVGPPNASQPAIQAARYQAPSQPATHEQANRTEMAQAEPLSQAVASRAMSQHTPAQNQQLASVSRPRRPMVTRLPKTASNLPTLLLISFVSLMSAWILRRLRQHVL